VYEFFLPCSTSFSFCTYTYACVCVFLQNANKTHAAYRRNPKIFDVTSYGLGITPRQRVCTRKRVFTFFSFFFFFFVLVRKRPVVTGEFCSLIMNVVVVADADCSAVLYTLMGICNGVRRTFTQLLILSYTFVYSSGWTGIVRLPYTRTPVGTRNTRFDSDGECCTRRPKIGWFSFADVMKTGRKKKSQIKPFARSVTRK